LDLIIIGLVIFILLGFFAYDYKFFGFNEQIINIPHNLKYYFDSLLWILFIVLILDLYLKYKVTKNWKIFIKKYWIDVTMTILIPIVYPFKFMKVSIKTYKMIKTAKYTIKIAQKIKKIKYFFKR